MSSTGKVVNGVDAAFIEECVKAIQDKPELAKFKFRLSNRWVEGGLNHSTVGPFHGVCQENQHAQTFRLECDEPPGLAGKDRAANPVEHLLNALAGCLTTTLVYHAAVRGIHIEELESELEGDLDLRGFLGLSSDVRRGYEQIRVKFRVKTDAANLEKLKALSKLSPVFDTVSKGTAVDVQIEAKA